MHYDTAMFKIIPNMITELKNVYIVIAVEAPNKQKGAIYFSSVKSQSIKCYSCVRVKNVEENWIKNIN